MQQPLTIWGNRSARTKLPASLLKVNGQVADLCFSVELEHHHRVHDVGTLISDMSLFDFEVHQLGQLGDPLHRGLERVD